MPRGVYDRALAAKRRRARTHDKVISGGDGRVVLDVLVDDARHRFRSGDDVEERRVAKQMREDIPRYSEGNIAPIVLQVLLWAHCRPEPIPDSLAVRGAIKCLDDADMIEEQGGFWTTTERGRAYVAALLAMRWPVAVTTWAVPSTQDLASC